ncbi:hypothetical protein C0992_010719, partial [Termitomyces sp. T32_za158]
MYARAVAPSVGKEYAPQAQIKMGTDVLLQRLEAAGQPVPSTVSSLQDNLAVMVMEGLLNQIKLMQRQRIVVLEQINHVAKHKILTQEGASGEPRRVKPRMADAAAPPVASSSLFMPVQPTATSTLPVSVMLVWPIAMFTGSATVLPTQPMVVPVQPLVSTAPAVKEPKALEAPMLELSLDQCNEEMDEERAGPAQMLFLKAILIPVLPTQLKIMVMATNLRTPVQYDGLMAMAAAEKGKQHAGPTIDDESNY